MSLAAPSTIEDRIRRWHKSAEFAWGNYERAARHGDATNEYEDYLSCVRMCVRLEQMLAPEQERPNHFRDVKKMAWRWLWWAKRCMGRERPAIR